MNRNTDRLLLRPITLEDAQDIFEYSKHSEVGPNAGWKPHETIFETKQVIKEIFFDKKGVFGIVQKSSGKMIGSMGLVDDSRRRFNEAKMLGYAIGKPYWGRGYATEAAKEMVRWGFNQMGLEVISAYCFTHNSRSRRVLEKCGMQYEGLLRRAERIYDGSIQDELCFSITKEEYDLIYKQR